MKLTSTSEKNRVESLDLLRGFSLLGIFIANMLMFHSPMMYIDPYTWFSTGSDATAFAWIDIFVQGSFYPIFAFLFGYGMNMQYEKALKTNQRFTSMMVRRLTVLLAFGLIHAVFIWSGDILFTYATLGFLLLFLVRMPAKWLWSFATVLYVIPVGFLYVMTKLVVRIDPDLMAAELIDTGKIEAALSTFSIGTVSEIFYFRLMEWLTYGLSSTFLGIFIILPLIMFGAAMSKYKLFERASEVKGKLLLVALITLPIGLGIKVLPYVRTPSYDIVQLQDTFGGVLLAAGYIALFLFVSTSAKFSAFFSPVGKAGRMSLTTYITQSILATLIFYSYGFGLYGKVSVWTGTFIAIGVFILQVIFAEFWLAKFRTGPIEKLWRIGTYGKDSTK